jgi:hypothetical protein
MRIKIPFSETDFSIDDFRNASWKKAVEISIEKYWSGENAPIGRHAKARILWTKSALYVCFEANQKESLIVNKTPNIKSKSVGLWDRDVCEIFVAPDFYKPEKYFEFEVAPTGEWVDLAIEIFSNEKRETDFQYNSGMKSAAKIEKEKILSAIKIEWKAFGKTPNAGDVWKGNLFRCVGAGSTRGYLAWQPTKTAEPNFHVPGAFGEFKFVV